LSFFDWLDESETLVFGEGGDLGEDVVLVELSEEVDGVFFVVVKVFEFHFGVKRGFG